MFLVVLDIIPFNRVLVDTPMSSSSNDISSPFGSDSVFLVVGSKPTRGTCNYQKRQENE
jgi:hypothetical protein